MIGGKIKTARNLLNTHGTMEKKMQRLAKTSLIALLLAPVPAVAGQFQDTKILDTAVAQFTGHAIGEEGGARMAVDDRLKLAPCALPQFEWLSSFQDAVVVHCMAPEWKIYVSVVRTKPVASAVVASAPSPVPVKTAPVIKRGDPIVIEADGEGFSITRDGVAMGDAAPGERLLVRVEDKKPPIQAVAVSAGIATLPGWAQ